MQLKSLGFFWRGGGLIAFFSFKSTIFNRYGSTNLGEGGGINYSPWHWDQLLLSFLFDIKKSQKILIYFSLITLAKTNKWLSYISLEWKRRTVLNNMGCTTECISSKVRHKYMR